MRTDRFCQLKGGRTHLLSCSIPWQPLALPSHSLLIYVPLLCADDLLVEGDPGLESIFGGSPGKAPLPSPVGATGAGDGGHWMTGPIYVCGAEPGDVLQVRAQM